jgi:hypothetical protein
MAVERLPDYLKQHWPEIREQLLSGTYQPQPAKRVEIPKPDGGVRKLGIPTALDRWIQQMVLQVLQRSWDPTFCEHSYARDVLDTDVLIAGFICAESAITGCQSEFKQRLTTGRILRSARSGPRSRP